MGAPTGDYRGRQRNGINKRKNGETKLRWPHFRESVKRKKKSKEATKQKKKEQPKKKKKHKAPTANPTQKKHPPHKKKPNGGKFVRQSAKNFANGALEEQEGEENCCGNVLRMPQCC